MQAAGLGERSSRDGAGDRRVVSGVKMDSSFGLGVNVRSKFDKLGASVGQTPEVASRDAVVYCCVGVTRCKNDTVDEDGMEQGDNGIPIAIIGFGWELSECVGSVGRLHSLISADKDEALSERDDGD